MNKLKQFILMLVMMFAVFLPLSNLTIKADQTDTSLEDIKKSGKLVVGLSADYPPYEFTAKVDGKTEYVGMYIFYCSLFKLLSEPQNLSAFRFINFIIKVSSIIRVFY